MSKNKNTKKIVIALLALVVVIGALFGIYRFTKADAVEGQKQITLEVVHGDAAKKEFDIKTTREYLGEALKDEQLVEGDAGEYGLFITEADGEAADASQEEWWCLTKDGEMVNTSADQTPIADGETYELTLTTGY